MTNEFQNYKFKFDKDGNVDVEGDPAISGKWTTAVEKNPTRLELTLTPFEPFFHLNADWTVVTIKSKQITLELPHSTGKDLITLTRT